MRIFYQNEIFKHLLVDRRRSDGEWTNLNFGRGDKSMRGEHTSIVVYIEKNSVYSLLAPSSAIESAAGRLPETR